MSATTPAASAPAAPVAPETGLKAFVGSAPWSIRIFAGILLAFVLMALLSPLVAPLDPFAQSLTARMKAPGSVIRGATYLLGSDELGRDVLSRIIYGARASMSVAFLAVFISGAIGTTLGLVAAFYRGLTDSVIMRLVDVVLSGPALLFAIIVVAVLGPGFFNVILVLGLTRWPRYARIVYGQCLGLMNQPYIKYARFVGVPTPRILRRHLLPNVFGQLVVVATLEFGVMVLFEAGLSFLGLGVQPPTPSWGAMMSVGRHYIDSAWWIAAFPGCCLFLLVLAINITGDFLRDKLDPRLR
jgi:peptide/nickel transport system permease protein